MSKVANIKSVYDYSPTNLNWLPNIPNHWSLKRLKDLGVGIIGLTYSPLDIVGENDGGILVLRSSNIQNDKLSLLDNVYVNIKPIPKLILKKGDILICTRNGSRALIGKNICIDEGTEGLTFGAFMSVFRTKYFRFVSYYFKSLLFDYQSGAFMTSTINQLTINTLNNLVIPFLSLNEQTQIANYLDSKIQAIDKKINLLTTKIEYYKELRKTIINNAVIKGLDKTVKLKESELGLIPIHWTISRLKEVSKTMSSGATPLTNNEGYYKGGIVNWINTGDLNDGIVESSQYKISQLAMNDYPNLKLNKPGTLMIAMYGATIGKIGLLNILATTNQACCCINFNKHNFCKFYFYWFLAYKHFMISLSVGGTQPNIGQGIIGKMVVAVPPKQEQTEIATYLDTKTGTIDKITSNLQTQIETLKELRKTLINDVVTGKIKVTKN